MGNLCGAETFSDPENLISMQIISVIYLFIYFGSSAEVLHTSAWSRTRLRSMVASSSALYNINKVVDCVLCINMDIHVIPAQYYCTPAAVLIKA